MSRWAKIKETVRPYLKWKMLLVFGVVWIITTGWSYVFIGVGLSWNISWMYKIGIGAQIFFWNPLINEKILTIPFSIWLYVKVFKEDPKEAKSHQEKKKIRKELEAANSTASNCGEEEVFKEKIGGD